MQPKRTQVHPGSNLVAFDAAGTKVYGLSIESDLGLSRIQVLADGLVQELVVPAGTGFSARALSFADNRLSRDTRSTTAPDLTADGVISAGPTDCVRQRQAPCSFAPAIPTSAPGRRGFSSADSRPS